MYNFILNMWIMRKIDEPKVQSYVVKAYITQEEANIILATPQVPAAQLDIYAQHPKYPIPTSQNLDKLNSIYQKKLEALPAYTAIKPAKLKQEEHA